MNKTKVTSRGQTVIPSTLRKIYGIKIGTAVEWIPYDDKTMLVRRVSRKRETNWHCWLKAIRRLDTSFWKGIDPVSYTRSQRENR